METPFRLFPGLDPADLPADADGFVRSDTASHGFFQDGAGRWITGWRAVNFMPYGIFTPMTGSVSGIYIRLPKSFMQREDGGFDLETHARNLDLVERAIQDRLGEEDGETYQGAAQAVALERGLYPVGTEFAHPLHYVDVVADGRPRLVPIPALAPAGSRKSAICTSGRHSIPANSVPASRKRVRRYTAMTNRVGWTMGWAGIWLATSKIRAVRCARKIAKN
ncbi:MAG: hypothetical protein R3F36_14425 [Candidatus Competibacteraceae bacterium]